MLSLIRKLFGIEPRQRPAPPLPTMDLDQLYPDLGKFLRAREFPPAAGPDQCLMQIICLGIHRGWCGVGSLRSVPDNVIAAIIAEAQFPAAAPFLLAVITQRPGAKRTPIDRKELETKSDTTREPRGNGMVDITTVTKTRVRITDHLEHPLADQASRRLQDFLASAAGSEHPELRHAVESYESGKPYTATHEEWEETVEQSEYEDRYTGG